MTNELTKAVSNSLGVTEDEAEDIINEQATIGRDMLSSGDFSVSSFDDLLYDMGIEPDYMMDFLDRLI